MFILTTNLVSFAQDYRNGIPWAEPAQVEAGIAITPAPSDAIVLFDGSNLDAWERDDWEIADGVLTVKPGTGDLRTKQKFGSCQVHLEFATPSEVDPNAKGQARGNSGLFLMDHYEVQILDNYDNTTYFDGQCGSLYKQYPPYVNVCKKPGEWQSYDVIFTKPILKIEDGKVVEVVRPAYVTVIQNGVVVQNHFALQGDTFYHIAAAYQPHGDREPIRLQDHNNRMQFRNIWIREIPDDNAVPGPVKDPYYADGFVPQN